MIHGLKARFLKAVDRVITVSPGSTAAVLRCGVPRSRISECHNAVDVQRIATDVGNARQTVDAEHFLFCGQLIERKNPGTVVSAISRMGGPASLLVVGDGPLESALQQQIAALGWAIA